MKKIKRIKKSLMIAFKVIQMLHVPSCALLYFMLVFFQVHHGCAWWEASKSAHAFVFAAMGCFAINDYYDYEKDCINKPYRLLPLGLVPRATALYIGYCLFMMSIVCTVIYTDNILDICIYLFIIALAYVYGRFINHLGKIKNIYTAVTLGILFIFMMEKTGQRQSILVYLGVIIYITGKELLMDSFDMDGDAAVGQITFAVKYGDKNILDRFIVAVHRPFSVFGFA